MVSFPLHCKAYIGVLIVDVIEQKGCSVFEHFVVSQKRNKRPPLRHQ